MNVNKKLSFGLIFDDDDNDDENYCLNITYEKNINTPTEYSLKHKIKYVLDQRCHNICVPCTILNKIIVNSNNEINYKISRLFLYANARLLDKKRDSDLQDTGCTFEMHIKVYNTE